MKFKKGYRVIDINPNWPRCYQTGTVVSVKDKGNYISWKSDVDGKVVTDLSTDMRRISYTNKGVRRNGMKFTKNNKSEL